VLLSVAVKEAHMSIVKRWHVLSTLALLLLAVATGAEAAPGPVSSSGSPASGVRHATSRDAAVATSFGCREDRVAAIPGYYATEKTCVEYGGGGIRAHSVTRCWRDGGTKVECKIINGDTVIAQLWWGDGVIAGTAPGDNDCGPCFENSHYSQAWCPARPQTKQAKRRVGVVLLGTSWKLPGCPERACTLTLSASVRHCAVRAGVQSQEVYTSKAGYTSA
jgi:hypothetical protein